MPPSTQTASPQTHGRFIPGETSKNSPVPALGTDLDWFWGRGDFAKRGFDYVELAARQQVPLLIVGETGTGKEIMVRRIHERRRRLLGLTQTEAPFVAVNCGALPESLAESILFGHERGAFTSARDRQLGRFELARQGTLFLDEIQTLPASCQAKLLRVIQYREFERLGSRNMAPVECQIVVASGLPLELLVEKKEFRKDLYYRINVCPFFLPSLRQRMDEFDAIVHGLLQRASVLLKQAPREITSETRSTLKNYAWPGNLRELEHALLYACLRSEGRVQPTHLPPHLTGELAHYIEKGNWQ